MKYRSLPKANWKISEIGFGCMSLQAGAARNEALLQEAFELGINYFDTADLYDKGENERIVGRAIKGFRKKVILATKVGNQWRPDGSGWDWNPRKEYILEAVKSSLKRLQTDYIDLYQLHGGTLDDPIDETIEAFEILKSQGLIREYGLSSIRPNVIREYINRSNMVSVMMQYSLLDRRPEESCLDLLAKHEIAVMVRGALAKGLLIDKPPKPYLDHSKVQVAQMAAAVSKLSQNHRTAGQTAIRYTLQHPAVCSVIAGIRNQAQLLDNTGASASSPLTDQELAYLGDLLPAQQYLEHR